MTDKIEDTAKTEADKIIGDARVMAANIVTKAEDDARALLKNARIWVAEKETDADTLLFGWIGKKICTADSRIADVIDFLLGNAKSCYCCAAIRAALITLLSTVVLEAIIFLIAHHSSL